MQKWSWLRRGSEIIALFIMNVNITLGGVIKNARGEFNDASALGRLLYLCQALHITNGDYKVPEQRAPVNARIVELASAFK